MKANAETSVKPNVPAVQTAAAIPDPCDLDGWVVEVDERTGALATARNCGRFTRSR